MATSERLRSGTWEPERLWWFLDTVDIFRGLRWTLESAPWSGTMISRGRGLGCCLSWTALQLDRSGKAVITVKEVASESVIAESDSIDRQDGGALSVRGRSFVFRPHTGDGWQNGELAPRPAHHVFDDDGHQVLLVRSGTIKPNFQFEVADQLDDQVVFPLIALSTAVAIRLRLTGRGGRGRPRYI